MIDDIGLEQTNDERNSPKQVSFFISLIINVNLRNVHQLIQVSDIDFIESPRYRSQSDPMMTTDMLDASESSSSKSVVRGVEVKKVKKGVRFCNTVKVILIPTRMEYEKCDLVRALWWRWCDIADFKESALKEIEEIRLKEPSMSLRQALSQLYQPSLERYLTMTAACLTH